jgi:YebC/PmpR family DNA-binding regulatory protein
MSGHSKWSSIKHKKAAVDAKRGKIFSKLAKEIAVSAKLGGGDPDANARLRTVLAKARAVNMPAANIERAIKKGTGELPGVSYEEASYECYGPGGVAILMTALTDNRNRTVAELRHLIDKHNGRMADAGSVSWQFDKKGLITVPKGAMSEDDLLEAALDAGAEDISTDDEDYYEVYTDPREFAAVKEHLESKEVPIENAELAMIPKNTIRLTGGEARQTLKLVELLEDHDDVQEVHSNFDIPNEIIAEIAGE